MDGSWGQIVPANSRALFMPLTMADNTPPLLPLSYGFCDSTYTRVFMATLLGANGKLSSGPVLDILTAFSLSG